MVDNDGNQTTEVTGDVANTDKTICGTADPDFFGSFGNNLSYKGFNLSFLFNFSVGGQIYYHYGYKIWNDGNYNQYSIQEAQLDRWQKPGDLAANPQRIWLGNNESWWPSSSRFLLDNNFLRLKDITFSYSLPKALFSKLKINNITVYMQATNFLTWAQQDLCDPEQRSNGMTSYEMPNNKTLTFGLEIGF
jgi:hypothetical protein